MSQALKDAPAAPLLADSIAQPERRRGIPAPEPGVYPGVDAATYHAWECASNSRLSKLRRSPAHLKAYLEEPAEETSALIMGRAIHSAILEPDDFAKRYVSAGDIDRRTKIGKEKWEALNAQYGDGYVLKADDYEMACRVRRSVYDHQGARGLLGSEGFAELSVVADLVADAEANDIRTVTATSDSPLRCKVRLDRLSPLIAGGAIVDIKTTRDASPRAFERAIFEHGYHRQCGLYVAAARANGIPAEHFVIVAVEKTPPFAVALYRLTEGAMEAGIAQLIPAMNTYAMCLALNEWPGYSAEVTDIALPAWSWSQIDEETSE